MTPEQAYGTVWRAVYRTVPLIPALADFLPALPETPAVNSATSTSAAPGVDLAGCRTHCLPHFFPLIDALAEARDHLDWNQTYTEADGVTSEFLQNYGYIYLTGPCAPLEAPDHRLFIAYWGVGLIYPDHNHLPAEVYAVLAGRALFRAEGRPERHAVPGDTILHEPWQMHATDMIPEPLLALIGWRADDLTVDPKIRRPE